MALAVSADFWSSADAFMPPPGQVSKLNIIREGRDRTCTLDQERNNISGHEHLGEPLGPNQRVLGGLKSADDAPENHVDGGRIQGGSEKDKDSLYDERAFFVVWLLGGRDGSHQVSECFNCEFTH